LEPPSISNVRYFGVETSIFGVLDVSHNPISSRADWNIGLSPALTDRGFFVTSIGSAPQGPEDKT
jgi:hypothetical protein